MREPTAWRCCTSITRGQYEFPEGLFFGGVEASWSNRTLREVLRAHARRAVRIAWIDVHTGLGPNGAGERIYAARDDAATLRRARQWWDGAGKTPVTSVYDGSAASSFLTGMMFNAVYDESPQAEYTGIAMEYGRHRRVEGAGGCAGARSAVPAGRWAWAHCRPLNQAQNRRQAISSSPSKIRLSTSSKFTHMLGAIFQPAPPVMKQAGSAPQCWRTCCTMRSTAPAIA